MCGLLIGVTIKFISKTYSDVALATNTTINTLNSSVAEPKLVLNSTELFDKVKILCLVLTSEPNHKKRAIHVKNTWGPRCNKLIFVSNVTDNELGSMKLQLNDNYRDLWGKTKHVLTYAYEHFYNEFDWFYKADDDTYAILDNMRYMLSAYSPNDPIYFGKKFKFGHKLGYFSGGAGYVMSKRALQKFVLEAIPDKKKCRQTEDGPEDWELGICMYNIGVYPGDGRDQFKREKFFPFHPEMHLFAWPSPWYWSRIYYPTDEGLDCCSNYTISFHYIHPDVMYMMEYVIFYLQAYGLRHVYDPMPQKKNFTTVVQTLLAEVNTTNVYT